MTSYLSEGLTLVATALIYLVVLVLAGELYWGSGALVLFGSIWTLQAAVFAWKTLRRLRNHGRTAAVDARRD